MAATIERGAPPLEEERPDLPKRLLAAIAHAVAIDPAKRPPAAALAKELRSALTDRRRAPRVAVRPVPLPKPAALLPVALAGGAALAGGTALPFYPTGWAPVLALLAALAAFRAPRAGLALALAVPILPLGNLALGLALLYSCLALGWLVLTWRDARLGLLFLAGPLLAPLGLLGLVPLVAAQARGPVRRAAQTVAAVAVAALAAALRGNELPFASDVTALARPGRPPRAPSGPQAGSQAGFRCTSRSVPSPSPRSPSRSPTPARPGGSPRSARAGSRSSCSRPRPRPLSRSSPRSGSRAPLWPPSHGGSACGPGIRLIRWGKETPVHEHVAKHRAEDRGSLRGNVRARLPDARAAGRAGAQAGEGDGRAPHDLGLARLRPERVLGLPRPRRSRAVRELRGIADRRAPGLPRRARPP